MNTDRLCQILFIILLLVTVAGCGVTEDISQVRSTNTVQPTQTATLTPTATRTIQPTIARTPTATQRFVFSTETSLPVTPVLTMKGKGGMTLLYVPAGEFTMGSYQGAGDERPARLVTLDAFWIDQTEVTNKMYSQCVEAGACKEPINTRSSTHSSYYGNAAFDNYPVIYVDWSGAKAYCDWAGRRLPTEAEWEKAARGEDANVYPWGNTFNGSLVNFCDTNCTFIHADKSSDDGFADVAPVGSYPNGASVYGALDMAGNVWEWVNDWFSEFGYTRLPASNPLGLDSGVFRALRGGSWHLSADSIRATNRSWGNPSFTSFSIGFRCARSP